MAGTCPWEVLVQNPLNGAMRVREKVNMKGRLHRWPVQELRIMLDSSSLLIRGQMPSPATISAEP